MVKASSVSGTQPAVTIDEISDPTLTNTGIELIDQDAVQLQSTPFRARRVTVRLEAAAVVYHSSNLRARTHTSVREGWLAYVTFGPKASGTVNGLPNRNRSPTAPRCGRPRVETSNDGGAGASCAGGAPAL